MGIGNYLNGGTFRGGAYGFRPNTLAQLTSVRANDDETSLMEYMITVMEKKFKKELAFVDELSAVPEAADVSAKQSMIDAQQLSNGVNQIKVVIEGATAKGDKLPKRLKPFLSKCEPQVKGLQE